MYTLTKWRERIRQRNDMTAYLTHLTRGVNDETPVDVVVKILKEKRLRASKDGFINGGEKVVCFQDAPIYGVSQNVKHEIQNRTELGNKVRYEPVGLSIPKRSIFNLGGRPVIYEQPIIKNGIKTFPGINSEQLWRVVSLDLSDPDKYIDWTHEREWRIKGDVEVPLHLSYVIVSDYSSYREFQEKADKEILNGIAGIITLEGVLY